ncbi:unnamed protein product [Ilex paraguariensis]|uniref:DUF4005 domain-containing protein n=1 Tax=Ilex paraguariensis TaxID=185542 RepID=A0ABC8UDE4_9AQUA
MGRSGTSCFKIITCGSDSADNDDLNVPESKSPSDKPGWTFRKRSARHRVLSNTVISETPSSGIKERQESATVTFQTQTNSTIPEKAPGMQWADEKPKSVDLELSETISATEDNGKADVDPEESAIIVIQAAIRGFLAQRALLQQKNIVKLQAAVRGHLVRRNAVGTLRCLQAIIKMQALVRAHHVRLSREGSSIEEMPDGKDVKDNHSAELLEKKNTRIKPHVTYTSIEKLLRNRFARELLASTPRTKPINITCDPSKSDSSWKWLELWMSVSSTGNEQPPKLQSSTKPQELERVDHSGSLVETVIPSDSCCKSTDSKSSVEEAAVPPESEETLATHDADSFNFQVCQPTSYSASHSLEQLQPESTCTSNLRENSLGSLHSQMELSDSISKAGSSPMSSNHEIMSEQPKHDMKKFASEQLEIEGKKVVYGPRKASNPAFIAAQSKFEELSSAANSTKSMNSLNQDIGAESYAELVSPAKDNAFGTGEIGLAENSVPPTSRVEVAGSECGTELSITSTLDSPDRSEAGVMEVEQEANFSEDEANNSKSTKSVDGEAKGESVIIGTDLSNSISVQPEKSDDVNGVSNESVNTLVAEDSSQVLQKTKKNASDIQQIELEYGTDHQVYKPSPEESPRSHITVPESQETPSPLSLKAKKPKSGKRRSNAKPRSLSADKSSFSNSNHDSGARSSLEQLPKDFKTGKRRNSFGSAQPDHVDQEPRDSSSSKSLPNYMQATESVRAKALANSSPRSSPDVHDKDIYMKKRHSLPGANGRQGSPRIQRSPSQAQQIAKGNGTHHHDRKWQR